MKENITRAIDRQENMIIEQAETIGELLRLLSRYTTLEELEKELVNGSDKTFLKSGEEVEHEFTRNY